MYAKCTVTPAGPRGLHFRGRRPIPRLPDLASSCARPLGAAALRDVDGAVASANGRQHRTEPGLGWIKERRRDGASWFERKPVHAAADALRCTLEHLPLGLVVLRRPPKDTND